MQSLRLDRRRYYNGKAMARTTGGIATTYDYMDETGEFGFRRFVTRRAFKSRFWIANPNGDGGWITGSRASQSLLYRLPEVIEAIALGRDPIAEGEKDVNASGESFCPATCNPDGAQRAGKKTKWRAAFTANSYAARILSFCNDDVAGHEHADFIAQHVAQHR